MIKSRFKLAIASIGFSVSVVFVSSVAWGEDEKPTASDETKIVEPRKARTTSAILMEEVVTTSRKKSVSEGVQDVPIAMNAYSGEQLEALQMRNIADISLSMPNVQLDSVGTQKGTANFSIRGQGINSSVLSVDPTVGLFVDGIYLGITHGLVDNFDLESLEVLRGPQGTLFGRNVTGGAVVMRNRRPSHDFSLRVKASNTIDDDQVYSLSMTGSLVPDVLAGKLALYHRNDGGYWKDVVSGNDFGASETYMIRPAVTWTISDDLETTLIFERGEDRGDMPPPHNPFDPELDDFEVKIHDSSDDFVGAFTNARWMHVISETNYDVAFGNGTITNIMGYREVQEETSSDFDGTNLPGYEFHVDIKNRQDQFSNELRYAGTFMDDKLSVTTGAFFFKQNIITAISRQLDFSLLLGPAGNQGLFNYGGHTDHETWGLFTNIDYRLTDQLNMTLGLRYTYEEKDADVAIAKLATDGDLPGGALLGGCLFEPQLKCGADFVDGEDWANWTPKVGFQYYYNDSSHIYFSYSKGFRSGGFAVRNTGLTDLPGPWDEESQDTFEIGLKADMADGRVRLNMAVFYNEVSDMIRQLVVTSADTGTSQTISNTADATISGVEMDINWLASDNLLLYMNVGYLDGEYTRLESDLNGDGVTDGKDKSLDLPRLSPWTGTVGGSYDIPIDSGLISMRMSYSHRSGGFYNDSNKNAMPSHDAVNAGLSFTTQDGKWKASLFGKNLLDQVLPGIFLNLPGNVSALYPTVKGREVGIEIEYQY